MVKIMTRPSINADGKKTSVLQDEIKHILDLAEYNRRRSMAFSQAMIPIYIEILLILVVNKNFLNIETLISIGTINISLLSIFNIKSNIHAIAAMSLLLHAYELEDEIGLENGIAHYWINKNREYTYRYMDKKVLRQIKSFKKIPTAKFPTPYEYALYYFQTIYFDPLMLTIILTSALSSLQIGVLVDILLYFIENSTVYLMILTFIFSAITYLFILWLITLHTWKYEEKWNFATLKKINPEFYNERHPFCK